jgi:nucleoside-diphosphate-sugar epimerase
MKATRGKETLTGAAPTTESDLDELLSRPTAGDVEAMTRVDGDILVLGAGGKMGPSLVQLARRASDEAGVRRRIIAVSRFATSAPSDKLRSEGIDVVSADLLSPSAVTSLPDVPNVIFMVGQKFGTSEDPASTWATNVFLPGVVLQRFAASRVVVFSTGNVYPLVPVDGSASRESDTPQPIGEYAQSALARERIVGFFSETQGTPTAILRLNYAVELRYGVLRDIADQLLHHEPIDLTMGFVNVIWQRDANAVALRSLQLCSIPPLVLNVTGPERLSVRDVALQLADRLKVKPVFSGGHADTALLSDASESHRLLGPPAVNAETLINWVAEWVGRGGGSLGQPTHFQERAGQF